jgi:hypothetical protein
VRFHWRALSARLIDRNSGSLWLMPERTVGSFMSQRRSAADHVQRAVWERIMAALAEAGVELLAEKGSFGPEVRWTAPQDPRDE